MRTWILISFLFVSLTLSIPVKAETSTNPLDGDAASVWELVEQIISGNFLNVNGLSFPVSLSGCAMTVGLNLPYIDFKFSQTTTCPVSGTVSVKFFPMQAKIRLEFKNLKLIEALDADVALSLKKVDKAMVFTYNVTNGRLAYRLSSSSSLQEMSISAIGYRKRENSKLEAKGRLNVFDKSTGAGRARLRTVTSSPKATTIERCDLSGANAGDAYSGTLSNCQ